MADKVLYRDSTSLLIVLLFRYQLNCPELKYRLAPIKEYIGRENISVVLHFDDIKIEVFFLDLLSFTLTSPLNTNIAKFNKLRSIRLCSRHSVTLLCKIIDQSLSEINGSYSLVLS